MLRRWPALVKKAVYDTFACTVYNTFVFADSERKDDLTFLLRNSRITTILGLKKTYLGDVTLAVGAERGRIDQLLCDRIQDQG